MTLPVFTPPIPPSAGTETDFQAKILKADFGDGYTQRSADGLNNVKRSTTLAWNNLSIDEAQALEDFFVARGGWEPFIYSLSDDVPRQWIVETDWKRTRDAPNTFSCVLVEDFSILG